MSLRYERKFIVPLDRRDDLDLLIRTHPAGFYRIYPPRYVNSLYFDDLENTNWHDSENGVFNRKKIRIRWYGDLQGEISTPQLEIKFKQGSTGGKKVYPLKPLHVGTFFDELSIVSLWEGSGLPEDIRNIMHLYSPSLMNRYHRRYLLSADGSFRLTIDDALLYFPVTASTTHLGTGVEDTQATVLELKYQPDKDAMASHIANHWPFRLSRKSKYATGMNRTRCLAC